MLLLTTALQCQWIDIESIRPASDILNREMAFFFIPPGVGLMLYLDIVQTHWLAILFSCFFSTFLIMFVVAYSFKWLDESNS